MKTRSVAKRVLSVLLAMSIAIGTTPITAFATVTTTEVNATGTNVSTIQTYASQVRDANSVGQVKSDGTTVRTSYADGQFTWDTEGKTDSWRYFNGVMLDAFMMLGGDANEEYVRAFYDDLIVGSDGNYSINQYLEGELDSVPMGRALFDLLPTNEATLPSATKVIGYNAGSGVIASIATGSTTTTLTFNDPSLNDGNGVATSNKFFGTDTSNGVAISLWVTPQKDIVAGDDSRTPLITFSNKTTKEFLKFDLEGSLKYRNYADDNDSNNDNVQYTISTATMTKGESYFVTAVINDSDFSFYVNGELISHSTTYVSPNGGLADIISRAQAMLSNEGTNMHIGGVNISDTVSDGNEDVFVNDLAAGTVVSHANVYFGSLTADIVKQLYEQQYYEKYKDVIQYIYNQLSAQTYYNQCGGNYLHKTSWTDWNIGLDGLYMAQPFLMECANAINAGRLTLDGANPDTIYSQVYTRIMWVADNMYDETTGLYHHGWSVENNKGNGHYWSRGIGWYAAALVDIIELMPTEGTCSANNMSYADMRLNLITKAEKLFDGMLKWQDYGTGMWNNVINREDALVNNEGTTTYYNPLETSGSALMAYALMKAYSNNWVAAKYGEAGLRAYNGIVINEVEDASGSVSKTVKTIYKSSSVCTTDEAYCKSSTGYKADEAKGTGPLIMASVYANATASKLASAGVSNDNTATEKVTDGMYSVYGSGATALNIVDKNSDATVQAATYMLKSDWDAFEVQLTNQKTAATISVPVASDETVFELINGELVEVTGTNTNGKFVFKTYEPGIYVIGTEVAWDELTWNTYDKVTYSLVQEMVTGNKYVIGNNSTANGANLDALSWQSSDLTSISEVFAIKTNANGTYRLDGVDANNLFSIDDKGRIFSENGTTVYYLIPAKEGGATNLIFTTDDAVIKWTDTPEGNNNIYLSFSEFDLNGDGNYGSSTTTVKYDGAWKTGSLSKLTLWSQNNYTIQLALDGILDYSTNVGATNITEDLIKSNATIYSRADSNSTPTVIDWSDADYSWSSTNGETTLNLSKAGTYTMTVTYDGDIVGTIDVVVKDLNWKDVTEVTYHQVQSMDYKNTDGYVITQKQAESNTQYYIRWVPSSDGVTPTVVDSGNKLKVTIKDIGLDNGAHTISPVSANNTWFIDESGRIYSNVNNEIYYLKVNSDSLEMTKTKDEAATWTIRALESGLCIFEVSNINKIRYMKIGSDSTSLASSSSTYTNQYQLAIWSRNPISKVALDGTLSYSINKNDTTVTEESILENATIYAQTTTSTTPIEIDWNDSNVSYSWDTPLDVTTPGTYTMTVTYAGTELSDKIVVVVNPNEWVQAGVTYTLSNNMVSTHTGGYFIANWLSNPNTTLSHSNGTISSVSSGYQSKDTSVSPVTGVFNNITDDNLWLIDDERYIFSKNKNYYLSVVDGKLAITTTATTKWNISTYSSENITLNSGNYYLTCPSDFEIGSSGGTAQATIWQVNPAGWYALDGTLSHTVVVGDPYITNTTIKKYAEVLSGTVENDPNATSIPWKDVTCVWKKDGVELPVEEGDKDGEYNFTAAEPGVYEMVVSYGGVEVGTITVNVVELVIVDGILTGNDPITTSEGREPSFGNLEYTVTYSDGSKEVITVENGLTVSGYDLHTIGEQTAIVYYNGNPVGRIQITVSEDTYAGLENAEEPYPVYPEDGAVRIDKNAINDDFLFRNTGIAQVELDVAGVSEKKPLDVILVVDVSNSMGWSMDWFENFDDPSTAKEIDKVSKDANGNIDLSVDDKLDIAMDAASEFADILLGNNVVEETPGYEKNNTLTFVTFAGHDRNNHDRDSSDYTAYMDSVHTVFRVQHDKTEAKAAFEATEFYDKQRTGETGVNYYLQLGENTDSKYRGRNRGNTNYDYAFGEATYAINSVEDYWLNDQEMSAEAYAERQTVVIYMSDGAPSSYNDQRANGKAADYIRGTSVEYPDDAVYSEDPNGQANWTEYISNPNIYAQEMMQQDLDELYMVGFDLAHGGFSNYSWSEGELEPLFWNVAGRNSDGGTNVEDVMMPDNATELISFYTELANKLVNSGNSAKVTDVIEDDFTLLKDTSVKDVDGKEVDPKVIPNIEVASYELWTKDETSDTSLIGTRKLDSNNNEIKTVLETVSFNEGGTEAYSNLIDNGQTNILKTSNGVTTINAVNFTYTKDADGVETFEWYIGDISSEELALSYYIYLKNASSMENPPVDGVRDTNEYAHLEYIDNNGDYAKQVFPVPERSWGTAITTVEYYLVNDKGQPVNWAGDVIPFADRIIVSDDNYTQRVRWGETLTVYGWEHVPSGYALYSEDAYYTVVTEDEDGGTLTITDGKTVNGSSDVNDISTIRVDTDQSNIGSTKVAFGVVISKGLKVKSLLGEDKIVLDYGKDITIDVLANDKANIDGTAYTAELIGLVQYSTDSAYLEYTQTNKGGTSLECYYGIFTIENGVVKYELKDMLSEVEKIFTVIKITDKDNENLYYYLYQPLYVIPATSVYYETDFAATEASQADAGVATVGNIDVFTTVQIEGSDDDAEMVAWTTKTDDPRTESTDDNVQNDGTIGVNQTYGYDSTYLEDNYLSDGSSMYVEGEGKAKTTVSFSFTGSGFDIISRTGVDQGMIRVTAYKAGTTTVAKRMSVLNRSESTWGELYQIPVISMEMDKHGSYDVVIDVYDSYTYTDPDFAYLSRENQFYFDAVRIYDPINVSTTTLYTDLSTVAAADRTSEIIALHAYALDGEAYETVKEVRDELIEESAKFDISGEFNTSGVLFIERTGDTNQNYDSTNYTNIGPNNEVYLAKDQAIVFKLEGLDVNNIASIDIGAKAVDGTIPVLKATIAASAAAIKSESTTISKDVKSSTSQNYQLFDGSNASTYINADGTAYVYIANGTTDGTDNANVLSITDIKIAYKNTPTSTNSVKTVATNSLVDFANTVMYYEPDADVYSASFESDETRVFGKTTLTVFTEGSVETLEVTDRFGKPVNAISTYEEQIDGTRVWSVVIMMSRVGTQKYIITGYDKDGVAGESAEASVSVTYKEGGGWQDAKSIFKTLFNCRILSIKRSSGSKLRSINK